MLILCSLLFPFHPFFRLASLLKPQVEAVEPLMRNAILTREVGYWTGSRSCEQLMARRAMLMNASTMRYSRVIP
jgi:hypothetical protein